MRGPRTIVTAFVLGLGGACSGPVGSVEHAQLYHDAELAAPVDADGDGWSILVDCDDGDASVYPGAADVFCDGVDHGCDGAELLVPGSYPTIQDAVDAAADGDVVCVAAAVWDDRVVIQQRAIRLVGVGGANETVIRGWTDGSVIRIEGPTSGPVVVEGLTIREGYSDNGAGIEVAGASVVLRDLIVEDNEAPLGPSMTVDSRGGGLSATDAEIVVENAVFRDNTAHRGGGIHAEASTLRVSNVRFQGNEVRMRNAGMAWNGGMGGGIYAEDSAVVLDNVLVVFNEAHSGEFSALGAGLWLSGSTATIRSSAFLAGKCHTYGWVNGQGAGIATRDSSAECHGCVFESNVAGDGSVAYVWATSPGAELVLAHSALDRNTVPAVVIDHEPVGSYDAALHPIGLESGAPFYWDLHLALDSPLIDAGDPAVLDPDGSRSDIGIYGGPGAASWDLDFDGYPVWWHPGPYDPAVDPGEGWDCDDGDPAVYPGNGC